MGVRDRIRLALIVRRVLKGQREWRRNLLRRHDCGWELVLRDDDANWLMRRGDKSREEQLESN